MVYRILKNPFYTGIFEYPRNGGNWYHGKHKPLISEDLLRLAQEKIAEELRPKKKFQEFTFTKLMTCGYCGSGITAQEKTKNIADGTVRTYIYYSCTRHKDPQCKNPYLREENLVGQLSNLIDTIALDEIGARHIIDREVSKHNDFRAQMFGIKEKDKTKDINVRDYAKYMLKNGNVHEIRELLENLRSRIVMKDKKISLEK
jgi:predicted metal-binding protein